MSKLNKEQENSKASPSIFQNNSFGKGKGFLFTISIILFASTLVLFSLGFVNINIASERFVINSYRPSVQAFLSDDIASDLKSILGVNASSKSTLSSSEIFFSDSLPKNFFIPSVINDYNSFLSSTFFPRILGLERIDFSPMTDGSYEILFGEEFVYVANYSTDEAAYYSVSNNIPSQLDINLYYDGDLNSVSWSPSSGSTLVNIKYFDDANYFSISSSLNLSEQSLLYIYGDDSNILLNVGAVNSKNGAILIDINGVSELSYSVNLIYPSNFGVISPDFNARLDYSSTGIVSNSLIGVND